MPLSEYSGWVFGGCVGVGLAFAAYYYRREAERRKVAQWSSKKKLAFFCNASDVLMKLPIDQANEIERNSYDVLVRGNWRVHLTSEIENYLFPITREPGYNPTSVMSLLRAIRNIRQNYNDLPPDIEREFGNYPAGYLRYWTSKFPNLLIHVYDVMRVHNSDPSMLTFYK